MKKYRILKRLLIIVCVIVAVFAVTVGCVAADLFLIGGVKPIDTIGITEINADNSKIHLVGTTSESATAYKGYTYRIADGALYLRIYQVIVGFYRYGDFDISISGDFSAVQKIYIEDDTDSRLIWRK